MKSLLIAGLFASMCLSASAYDETTSYLSLNAGELINTPEGFSASGEGVSEGDELYVPVYIMNEGNIMPTNIEFAMQIPVGLTPSATEAVSPTETLVQGRAKTPMLTPNFSFHEEAWTDQSGNNLPARSLKIVLQNSTGSNAPIDCGEQADVCFLICTVNSEAAAAADADGQLEVKVLAPMKFSLEGSTVQNSTARSTKVKIKGVAVESIKGDKAIVGVKYYNVAGVESNEPFEGVSVKVTKYADGTTKAVKIVK